MLNISYKDWKTTKQAMDIMEIMKNRKWTWAGYISRRTDKRWRAALTVWIPMSGKRNRGR